MPSTDMHFGAEAYLFNKANELRLHLTPAEAILWKHLATKPFGLKFRRQHPIAHFIADFYCHSLKLIIEVDGGIHQDPVQSKYDKMRTEILNEHGISVIRFTNEEVTKDVERVLETLNLFIAKLKA